jgi:hypothetical protein
MLMMVFMVVELGKGVDLPGCLVFIIMVCEGLMKFYCELGLSNLVTKNWGFFVLGEQEQQYGKISRITHYLIFPLNTHQHIMKTCKEQSFVFVHLVGHHGVLDL